MMTASAHEDEDDESVAFSTYGQLQNIQDKLKRLIDRARYHGEHTASLEIFEEILAEVDVVIDHEERHF